MEITTDVLNKILSDFNEYYRNTVDTIFEIPYAENPEAFILYNLEDVDAFLLKTSRNYIAGTKYHLFLFQGTGNREFYELQPEDYKNLYKYHTDDDAFLKDFIINNYQPSTYITKTLVSQIDYLEDIYSSYDSWAVQTTNAFQIWAMNAAKNHTKTFAEHINNSAYIYADGAYKYTYTELDFSDVIKVMNDKDFEYALNESLAAFEKNLYLAATATAGTTLENLLLIILEKNNIIIDENLGTELGFLTNTLQKEGIIDRKMKRRIMNAASLRNLASHANKGRTIREDAKYVFQTIYTLAAEVYLPQA